MCFYSCLFYFRNSSLRFFYCRIFDSKAFIRSFNGSISASFYCSYCIFVNYFFTLSNCLAVSCYFSLIFFFSSCSLFNSYYNPATDPSNFILCIFYSLNWSVTSKYFFSMWILVCVDLIDYSFALLLWIASLTANFKA